MTTMRLAEQADIDALAALRWSFFVEDHPGEVLREDWPAFLARFREFAFDALGGGQWFAWVADDDGELRANIWIYLVPKVPRPDREHRRFGYVTNVYAMPDVRGRATGTELLRSAKAWAASQRLEMLMVWPSERSGAYYQRQGFLPTTEMLECELEGYEQ